MKIHLQIPVAKTPISPSLARVCVRTPRVVNNNVHGAISCHGAHIISDVYIVVQYIIIYLRFKRRVLDMLLLVMFVAIRTIHNYHTSAVGPGSCSINGYSWVCGLHSLNSMGALTY